MATLQYGGETLGLDFTNHFLAHLQVATYKRFEQGRGFFLVGTGPDPDGAEITFSHWLDPSIPLTFVFDVRDDSDQRVPPITLDHKEVDAILESMDKPTGVRGTHSVWLPFTESL